MGYEGSPFRQPQHREVTVPYERSELYNLELEPDESEPDSQPYRAHGTAIFTAADDTAADLLKRWADTDDNYAIRVMWGEEGLDPSDTPYLGIICSLQQGMTSSTIVSSADGVQCEAWIAIEVQAAHNAASTGNASSNATMFMFMFGSDLEREQAIEKLKLLPYLSELGPLTLTLLVKEGEGEAITE